MKIIAVIQARNGNDRLNRKNYLPLIGKPILQHVIERVSRAQTISEIIVAMPGAPEDECLFKICHEMGVKTFNARSASIEDGDIVGRFLCASLEYRADPFLRIAADNPCIEPDEIDKIAQTEMRRNFLLTNAENIKMNHDGFGAEKYSIDMFAWMNRILKPNQFYREQPHAFWYDLGLIEYIGKPYPRGFRLDVNTQADYEKLKSVFDYFGHNRFSVASAMEYLRNAETWEKVQRDDGQNLHRSMD